MAQDDLSNEKLGCHMMPFMIEVLMMVRLNTKKRFRNVTGSSIVEQAVDSEEDKFHGLGPGRRGPVVGASCPIH